MVATAALQLSIELPQQAIEEFCRRWKRQALELFGSVLRRDFGDNSDVDVLVTFEPEQRLSLFDFIKMQDELRTIFGRDVDLLTRRSVESSRNTIRKNSILDTARVVYAK